MGVVSAVDRAQRRHPALGFPLAVVYKFFDDQGNYLAVILTFYAFFATFPLMLLATSILGFVFQGNHDFEQQVLDSTLGQFPVIGDLIGGEDGLKGSVGAIVVGALGALYGAMGLGLALQNVQATAWSVPRNSRTNPLLIRVKGLLLLAFAGSAIIGISVLSAILIETELVGEMATHGWFPWLVRLLTLLILGVGMSVLLGTAAAKATRHRIAHAAPGGFTIAVQWQLLQYLGTAYVTRVLAATEELAAVFGVVLGMFGLLYIGAIMGVLGIEVNVVLARRLWPRALLTPFTDRVDLTDADRKAYAMYAQMQRHKGFETISVRFDGRDGDTHEIVLDPSTEQVIKQHIPGKPPRPEAADEVTQPFETLRPSAPQEPPMHLPPSI